MPTSSLSSLYSKCTIQYHILKPNDKPVCESEAGLTDMFSHTVLFLLCDHREAPQISVLQGINRSTSSHHFRIISLETHPDMQQAGILCRALDRYLYRKSTEGGWRTTGPTAGSGLVSMAPERKTFLLQARGHNM